MYLRLRPTADHSEQRAEALAVRSQEHAVTTADRLGWDLQIQRVQNQTDMPKYLVLQCATLTYSHGPTSCRYSEVAWQCCDIFRSNSTHAYPTHCALTKVSLVQCKSTKWCTQYAWSWHLNSKLTCNVLVTWSYQRKRLRTKQLKMKAM